MISITENCEATGVSIPILSPVLKFIKKKIEIVTDIDDKDNKVEGE